MTMEYIRRTYGVPAKRGMRVRYETGFGETWEGRITGTRAAKLRIKFDGQRHTLVCHPTSGITYLPVGKTVSQTENNT